MSADGTQEVLKRRVSAAVFEALIEICGGGLYSDKADDERSSFHRNDVSWTSELKRVAETTVSFPNKKYSSLDGKPHDVEVRCALTLFHKCTGRKRKRVENKQALVSAVSDLGVSRTIATPFALAECLCHALEELLRREELGHDVRPNASGIICLVTPQRAKALRDLGKVPCSQCVKWCKGEKGLWWHNQIEHKSEHSVAAAAAASEMNVLAIVPYDTQQHPLRQSTIRSEQICKPPQVCRDETVVIFELVRQGELEVFKQSIENGFDPRESLDRNGASPLLWAAGSGHLNIVKYLVESCFCSPHLGQHGKRSFSGRTPLHWSARNGHLEVVRYLVEKCRVDIDATTADGTTAFCWASWQGHLPIMKYLYESGTDVQKSNSFGCNAILWCAQGEGTVEAMQWLHSIGLNLLSINSNGHGALHKAAQRQRKDLCQWMCNSLFENVDGNNATLFDIIGTDMEGCCPSDLAGMGGDDELALHIAKQECRLASLWGMQRVRACDGSGMKSVLPEWFQREEVLIAVNVNQTDLNAWGPWGGARRIMSILTESLNSSTTVPTKFSSVTYARG